MAGEPDAAVVLACTCRPPSGNNATGNKRDRFEKALAEGCKASGRPRMDGLLPGVVCWFVVGHRRGADPDADDASKAVRDISGGPKPGDAAVNLWLGAFTDDKQAGMRVAGTFDLRSGEDDAPTLNGPHLAGMPEAAVRQLGNASDGRAAEDGGVRLSVGFTPWLDGNRRFMRPPRLVADTSDLDD